MQMWLIAVLRSLGFQAMSARKQDRLVTGGVWVEGMERVECVWLRYCVVKGVVHLLKIFCLLYHR